MKSPTGAKLGRLQRRRQPGQERVERNLLNWLKGLYWVIPQ